jgi:hypothetical protein
MDLYPVAAIWLSHSAQLRKASEELNIRIQCIFRALQGCK